MTTDDPCPVCQDGRCIACLSPEGSRLRFLARTDPAYRELFAAKWREAKADPSPPTLLDKAVNFAGAAIAHAAAGFPHADEAEKQRRLAICGGCEHFDAGRCRLCSCIMRLKASWALSVCPDNPPRW